MPPLYIKSRGFRLLLLPPLCVKSHGVRLLLMLTLLPPLAAEVAVVLSFLICFPPLLENICNFLSNVPLGTQSEPVPEEGRAENNAKPRLCTQVLSPVSMSFAPPDAIRERWK